MAPFGVELPESFESPSDTSQVPSESGSPTGESPGGVPSNESAKPEATKQELLDLEKLDRFRFAGREWKPKDLHNAYLMREDYSRKTQELAEARKFADNFVHDLRTIARDPARFAEFEKLYPTQYVEMAKQYLEAMKGQAPEKTQPNGQPSRDPQIEEMVSEFKNWKQGQKEAELKQIQSWLDNQYSTLGKKYPLANPEVINARAEVAARQGTKITEAVLEKLFKANDQETRAKWEEHYKTKVNKQLEAGKRARDIGPGGGTPSTEPKRPKTIREATQAAIEDITARARQ